MTASACTLHMDSIWLLSTLKLRVFRIRNMRYDYLFLIKICRMYFHDTGTIFLKLPAKFQVLAPNILKAIFNRIRVVFFFFPIYNMYGHIYSYIFYISDR